MLRCMDMLRHLIHSPAQSPMSLDHERRYSLRIKDLPEDEKPREKLTARGPDALSVHELLAVILNTGTTKEDILTMTQRIIREYGEQGIMHSRNPEKLADDMRIPIGKALQIVAVVELGRRFFARNNTTTPTIRTSADVFEHVQDMRRLQKERLRGLYLNAHYRLIHDEILSIGTIDSSIMHPRDVFKPALEYSAVAVVIVHNHPSGILAPSNEDIAITNQLIDAGRMLGIDLIDHIIVTEHAHASIPAPYTV